MSAGAPRPNVDTIPSIPPTHGLGHSRGRGHTRSSRSTPISHSVSNLTGNGSEHQASHSVAGLDAPNGSLENSHSHGHHHAHSHFLSHHDSFPAHNIKHTREDSMKENDETKPLGIQPEDIPKTHDEILAGFLSALPLIALSWYYQNYAQWTPLDSEPTSSSGNLSQTVHHTSILTAATMLLYGSGLLLRLFQQGGGGPVLAVPKLEASTASFAFRQVCSIAMPIYSAFKVGGFLVTFAFILALGSRMPTLLKRTQHTEFQARLSLRKLSVILLCSVLILSFLGLNPSCDAEPLFGYISLLISVFILRPPYSESPQPDFRSGTGLGISIPGHPDGQRISSTDPKPLGSIITILCGLVLGLATVFFARDLALGPPDLLYILPVASSFAISLLYLNPSHLGSAGKAGLATGAASATLFCSPSFHGEIYIIYIFRGILTTLSFIAARYDYKSTTRPAVHTHHHDNHTHNHVSKATKLILSFSEPYPLLNSILKERDSRRIFYFMTLNFAFMLVQLSYGFATGSLGLLSDSIHMFFDCLALVVGLCAAVMSKWPPSTRFPYGYGKVDTLSGFANGIFLMIISIEIIYEAVERLSSGSQMHRLGELLAVSFAGLLVNLVGIMAFDHGHAHGHDHGGHGHSHSHGNENMHGIFLHILADTLGSVAVVISTILVHYSGWPGYDPIASCIIAVLIFASAVPLVGGTAKTLLLALPADVEYNVRETLAGVSTLRGVVGYTVPKFWLDDTESKSSAHDHDHNDNHSCNHTHAQNNSHDHSHDHDHDHNHGHHPNHNHGHDHSHDHSHNHSHSHSHSHNHDHDHGHGHGHGHGHTHENPRVLGVIHVIASRAADLEDVRQRTFDFLREKNMNILVQVEREGEGRCWCGGGMNKSS